MSATTLAGEVEYIIITQGDEIYIGLGSDHTDRKLESASVPKAKQVCPKPIGHDIWKYSDLKDHWDSIKLNSYQTVDGKEIPYQQVLSPTFSPSSTYSKNCGSASEMFRIVSSTPVLSLF